MDNALEPHPLFRLRAEEHAEAEKPKPAPRGPVLIGDLTASLAGRPLLLRHWDEAED
jgi:hypothetical protein